MTSDNNREERASDMRKNAEKMLNGKNTDLKKMSTFDAQSLLHELQVHQIELFPCMCSLNIRELLTYSFCKSLRKIN